MQLPQELANYHPSPEFRGAIEKLNAGFQEAGQLLAKPMNAQTAMKEVTLPLLNLLSEYIKHSQVDSYRYFYSFCMFLYQNQAAAADDNIILAVDPELSEEVDNVVGAARENIGKAKAFIFKVQEYLSANKPARLGIAVKEGSEPDAEDAEALAANEANLELWQALREEALRVMSALNETDEDLGIMADNVESATYDPDSSDDVGDEGEDNDEVALPISPKKEDEPYESVVG
jgi:hypothetical protein